MKMKVTMDSTIRTVSIFTVLLVFSLFRIRLNMPAPRLRTISPSKTAMMTFTMSMIWLRSKKQFSVLDLRELSI